MSPTEKHVAWWIQRFPFARAHREDLMQEAAIAEWLAAFSFDATRGVKLNTFTWRRMYVAVRAYLQLAGVIRSGPNKSRRLAVAYVEDAGETPAPDRTDAPLVLAEAWAALGDGYERKGFTARHAEALARLDVGQTFAEAGAAVGISRQAVHQVASRAGVHATYTRAA